MIANCSRCGRPLVELDPPAFSTAKVNIIARTLKAVGMDAGSSSELFMLLNPSADQITTQFKLRHPGDCP